MDVLGAMGGATGADISEMRLLRLARPALFTAGALVPGAASGPAADIAALRPPLDLPPPPAVPDLPAELVELLALPLRACDFFPCSAASLGPFVVVVPFSTFVPSVGDDAAEASSAVGVDSPVDVDMMLEGAAQGRMGRDWSWSKCGGVST